LNKDPELVEVYRAAGELEALAIKSMLESFSIPALLRSSAAGSVHPFTVDGLGEVCVLVNTRDKEEAERLINSGSDNV
jgi:hypothetical protein